MTDRRSSNDFGVNVTPPRNQPMHDIGSRLVPWPDDVRTIGQVVGAAPPPFRSAIYKREDIDATRRDESRRRGEMRANVRRRNSDPLCKRCECVLSQYNDDTICGPCARSLYDHPADFTHAVTG